MHYIPLTAPERAIGSNEQFVLSLPARNERGESRREGQYPTKPPLPGPLLLLKEEREKRQCAETTKGN
jgi:hypothetical protein